MTNPVPEHGERRTVAVVGATGDVGRAVVAALAASGHDVRPVCRSAGVSLDDKQALLNSLSGAHAAYVMIPFDLAAPDLHAREADYGARLSDAVVAAGVERVVLLSGLNAPLKKGSSLGAALMEERLARCGIKELCFLRAGWIMENFSKGLNFEAQARSGTFATPFKSGRAMPMVSAADVGNRAASLLSAEHWSGERIEELRGAGDYSMASAASCMASALGINHVQYVQLPYEDARKGMLASGLSASFVDAVLATAQSFNDDEPWGSELRTARNSSPTALAAWARATFSPVSAVA